MEGGPKLRRWYGSDSSVGAPGEERVERKAPSSDVADADARASGSIGFDEATLRAFDAKPRRSVLVAGADTALGEAVVMQLIVAKQDVVVLGIAPASSSRVLVASDSIALASPSSRSRSRSRSRALVSSRRVVAVPRAPPSPSPRAFTARRTRSPGDASSELELLFSAPASPSPGASTPFGDANVPVPNPDAESSPPRVVASRSSSQAHPIQLLAYRSGRQVAKSQSLR